MRKEHGLRSHLVKSIKNLLSDIYLDNMATTDTLNEKCIYCGHEKMYHRPLPGTDANDFLGKCEICSCENFKGKQNEY